MAASSARQKQRITPAAVVKKNNGIDAAPMLWTASGAMPVTRMVPASPMTNAPHQFVFFCSPVDDD